MGGAMKAIISKGRWAAVAVALVILWTGGQAWATAPASDESALFTNSTEPDALIVLDLSGSMDWNPAGGNNTYGISSCAASTTYCTGTGCSGGFCSSSKTNCSTACSRLAIAKRAIFDLLDDNDDNVVNSSDETSLSVRIGYMRFYNCSADDTSDDYTSGCIQIPGSSSSSRRYIGSAYSRIYCNSNTSCTVSSTGDYSVGGASASGGTPLASSLRKAKIYLDAHKAADSAASCRKKFVILVTDGADTFACSGSGAECDGGRYKGRREFVARAKALADAGYKVFVVGFGAAMPDYLENTLNWAAYYGGTDNPNQSNAGSTSGYTPGTPGACTTATDAATATCYDDSGSHSTANFKANTNDPGYASLSGYAFLAADADQLATALKTAMNIIRQANYSFSQSSVQSSRSSDENFLYEGSFEPVDGDPFWTGHLKKYTINTDGTVGALSTTWTNGDAGSVLQGTSASSRNILTYKGGSLLQFSTSNLTATDLGAASDAARDAIVGFIRGETAYNPEQNAGSQVWKLGDVFRSTPITVGTPSSYYDDTRDCNNRFSSHRSGHPRTSANGNRLIVAGANDGQFHAFKTSDGSEAWSFVPSSLLTKLKNMTHSSHPTSLGHQYFVDGPVTVADVWTGADDGNCGTSCSDHGNCKSADSWRTLLVFGLGRGAVSYSWSDSSSCDSGIYATYTTTATDGSTLTHPYYCGFYAFNLNNSLSPSFLWVGPTFQNATNRSFQAPYLGDPWSKMMTGRVRVKEGGVEKEKWVGFVGAGYNAYDCSGGGSCDSRGKGFFVVDLTNGNIIWSFTLGSTTSTTPSLVSIATNANMNYSVPGQPAIVDTDNDGFIDTAYIGDLGGNMWRFKFCRYADMPNCGISGFGLTTTWSGGLFYASSSGNIRPIYTSPAVAKDKDGNLWVYWGTGDKTDPTASNAQERFFGVKDNRTSTYTFSNLDNITSATQTYNPSSTTNVGYAINLAGGGEKMLADPTVFGGVVYFTTYRPSNTVCNEAGTASLYAINYRTGGGALSDGARSMSIGTGIPSAPVLSLKPGGSGIPDLYVTTSGGSGTSASTTRVDITPAGSANRTNMLYWRDLRIQ